MSRIQAVLEHGRLVMGPEVSEFEQLMASFCNRKHCVSVGSGTDALYLALRSCGITAGAEVITTSLSWIATANAIALTGATPVFADVKHDLNIDPRSVENLLTERTRAILTVNYTGRVSDVDELSLIAEHAGVLLIEDAAQSFSATLDGRVSGSFGTISAMSHNPMKVFASVGEAGSILTDDSELAERLEVLRYNGTVNRETCITPSLNGRMDTLQAAVLIERLHSVEQLVELRRRNASYLDERLVGLLTLPPSDSRHGDVYYTYTVRSQRRDELQVHLLSRGIETKIQHPLLMPQQPAFADSRGEWLHAATLVGQVLCLPIHEKLTRVALDQIVDAVKVFGPSAVE
jgi:dTDP-4-amino-4,6-dideoxygalactose transaminase